MKITLLLTGKTGMEFVKLGSDIYNKRIMKYAPFEIKVLPDLKKATNLPESIIKEKEGQLIIASISPEDNVILLDERGSQRSSVEFANFLQQKMNIGIKNLVFIIGGAYGFSDSVYQRANEKISLSKMTFSHQLVRVIFLEQIYRALSILKGDPYHHE